MRASPIASSPLSPKPTCPLTPITAGGFICVSLSLSLSLSLYIYIYIPGMRANVFYMSYQALGLQRLIYHDLAVMPAGSTALPSR